MGKRTLNPQSNTILFLGGQLRAPEQIRGAMGPGERERANLVGL
jgi:hypothetical protein